MINTIMDISSFTEAIFGSGKDSSVSTMKPILHFPNDINSDAKSWISFYPYETTKEKDASASSATAPAKGLESSKESVRKNPVKIYLYHPEAMTSNVALQWEEQGVGWIDDVIKGYQDFNNGADVGETAIKTAKSIGLRAGLGGNVRAKFEKNKLGKISNPNLEVFFKGIAYREYSFSFSFNPKTKDEVNSMMEIIRTFKRFALPKGFNASYMSYPPTWVIQAKSKGRTINHFKEAVVTSVNVDSSPNQVWATFDDGVPVSVKVDINFKEMQLLSQQDYISGAAKNEGWF